MNIRKLDKNVGLPIHMISKLVTFLGGSFKTIAESKSGDVVIEFNLPFNSLSNTNKMMVKTPKVSFNKALKLVKIDENEL